MSNTIKLTFAGDATQLDKTMSSVGASSEKMAAQVGDSSSKVRGGFDSAGEGADASEGKFQGVADVTSGLVDGFQGITDGSLSMTERLQLLGGAGADLAGGFAQLIPLMGSMVAGFIPMIASAWAWTAALLANPMTWIVIAVIALIAAIVLLIMNFDKVKEVVAVVVSWVVDRWNWVKDKVVAYVTTMVDLIKNGFTAAKDWIVGIFNGVVDWFSKLPGRIGGFFSAIGDGIRNAFRGAFNFVADIWNNTVGRINFTIPSWVPGIGGNNFGVPKIPKFHTGGVVPGMQGQEMLAMLQAGERVVPRGGSGGGATITIQSGGGRINDLILEILQESIRVQGGNVQTVLGG
jgi:phage-related protein